MDELKYYQKLNRIEKQLLKLTNNVDLENLLKIDIELNNKQIKILGGASVYE